MITARRGIAHQLDHVEVEVEVVSTRFAATGRILSPSQFGAPPRAGFSITIGAAAPDVAGARFDEQPTADRRGSEGRVVLVEFWTYRCIDCRSVIPQLRVWHDQYQQRSARPSAASTRPSFFWKKPFAKVKVATARLDISFAVVQHHDFNNWQRSRYPGLTNHRAGRQKGLNPLQPYRRRRLQQNRVDDQTTARRIAAAEPRGGSMLIKKPADIKTVEITPKEHLPEPPPVHTVGIGHGAQHRRHTRRLRARHESGSPTAPRNSPTSKKALSAPPRKPIR